MSERLPSYEAPHDMTPEANADISKGHLLRWAMDHGAVHYREGELQVDELETDTLPPADPELPRAS